MDKTQIQKEVERTLGILKENSRQESNPYTFEKVMHRISRNGKEPVKRKYPAVLKYSLLVLVVIINLITVIKVTATDEVKENNISNKTETEKKLESITTEYNLLINY